MMTERQTGLLTIGEVFGASFFLKQDLHLRANLCVKSVLHCTAEMSGLCSEIPVKIETLLPLIERVVKFRRHMRLLGNCTPE